MQVKTISYKRILNLGNYESKHLEMCVEINETDDLDAAASNLMETVERKIKENITEKIEEEIRALRRELRELKKEQVAAISPDKEVEDDGIPFDKEESKAADDLGGF